MSQGLESISLRGSCSATTPGSKLSTAGVFRLQDVAVKRVERRLAAIMAADVAGYSSLMSRDEVGTLQTLEARRAVMDRLVFEHGGRIANTAGDSILAEFSSAVDAVQCAVEFQRASADLNQGVTQEQMLSYRIGIHIGDVMVRGGDLFGEGVNIAARLEALAEPGGVYISGDVHRQIKKALPLTFTDLGHHQVKNIDEAIQAFAVELDELSLQPKSQQKPGFLQPFPLPNRPSIAVLPFVSLGPDQEQEYFADGVVEDIIAALSRIRWLLVIARSSTFTYKGRAADVRQVGRELGVRYVLEGSVRKAGRRLRITGQLVEAATGRQIWADKLDGGLEDVFEFQDRITEAVVGAIEPNLRGAEIERARKKPTADLDVYDLYLRALPSFYKMTADGLADAIETFDKVVSLDPTFILGKAQASYARAVRLSYDKGEPTDRETAIRLAREVVASGTDDPEALRRVAHVLGYNARAYEEALGAITKSLELNPNSATAYNSSGWIRLYLDQPDAAEAHFRRAIRLSPVDPERGMATTGLAVSFLMRARHLEGLQFARQAVREMPQYPSAHKVLIQALVLNDREEEAQAAAARFLELSPGYTLTYQKKITPYSNQAYCLQLLDTLRRAGLPE
jgi:adenylate cyclase